MGLLCNERKASGRDAAYNAVRPHSIHPFAPRNHINSTWGNINCHALVWNQQTCICIVLREVFLMSSIALLMGKKHLWHCKQHGDFFGQVSVTANMKSNSSLQRISILLVLTGGWSGTMCIPPTAKRTKVSTTQSNALQSLPFLLMCCFVVKLLQ